MTLKYSKANAKIHALKNVESLAPFLANRRKVYSLDLLSGWSCPGAKDCLSKVHLINGKRVVKDGKHTRFRCFSASQEAVYSKVYDSRKHNFDALRNAKGSIGKFELLKESMPSNLGICRIDVGGDIFNAEMMLAWATMAEAHSDRLFYAYTKSLPFWLKYRKYINSLPNFVLTASRGGHHDKLIGKHRLRQAVVVFSEQEAADKGLEIDNDDSHAADPSKRKQSFALLLHGTQPAKSEASKALVKLKGKGSYGKRKKS